MAKKQQRITREGGYRFPRTARLFSWKPLYGASAVAGGLAIGTVMWQGLNAVETMRTPYVPPSPYQAVAAETTPGVTWARQLLQENPQGFQDWALSPATGPAQPATYEACPTIGLAPTNVLHAVVATAEEDLQVTAQLYNPGQAPAAAEGYSKVFAGCGTVREEKMGSPTTSVYLHTGGAFFVYGDVVFFIQTKNEGLRDSLLRHYLQVVPDSLTASSCLQLTTTAADAKRNLFARPQEYTGLLQEDQVKTKIDLEALPTPVYQEKRTLSYMDEPEGPLAPSIPRIPSAPPTPGAPKDIELGPPPFAKDITFQVLDPKGPGCGWAWSLLEEPQESSKVLQERRRKTYRDAYRELDGEAATWLRSKLTATTDTLSLMATIDTWNKYTKRVDEIHGKWRWLNQERGALLTPWYNYVEAHDSWYTFDDRKAKAKGQYEEDLRICKAQREELAQWETTWAPVQAENEKRWAAYEEELQAWRERRDAFNAAPRLAPRPAAPVPTPPSPSGTPSPTTTPPSAPGGAKGPGGGPANPLPQPTSTPQEPRPTFSEPRPTPPSLKEVPERPEGCDSAPEKPAILSQQKPAEPQAPAMKEGVTIPASWPKPMGQG